MEYWVEGVTHRGEGVIHMEGKVCFVPWALPGELIAAEVTQSKKSYARGRLGAIIEASPQRAEPWCPLFYACGGCVWQHVTYAQQLAYKRQTVAEQLRRIAHIEAEVAPVIGMENPRHYRNKVTWQVGRGKDDVGLGFFRADSHEMLPFCACGIIPPLMNEIGGWLNERVSVAGLGGGDQVVLRQSNVDGSLLLLLPREPSDGDFLPALRARFPEIASVCVMDGGKLRAVFGPGWQLQALAGCRYRIGATGFLQVNSVQADKLYAVILSMVGEGASFDILEAYCGSGTISCMLARAGHRVCGVEYNAAAVADADFNVALNGLAPECCIFYCGACEDLLSGIRNPWRAADAKGAPGGFDVVILDPPRAGCHPASLEAITDQAPPRIIYVSCDPATLARDLARFCAAGYQVDAVQPVDMFPHTAHVETVVALEQTRDSKI
ncbi:MAG: 23S rRNA (uracil(1939)-C(5))-methyltransferase RlmD [Syntrophomonadaceae bacterium]|nr:23S rRNA (uracil(1939)-C(5))-methyltransferase RlmD [Syntrophomonadaceae bacterium]